MNEPRQWLESIRERTAHAVSIDEMDESDADNVYELLAEVDRLRSEVSGYRSAICFETTCTGCAGMLDQLAQADSTIDQLRAALTTLARNEQAACNRSLELQEENERLRAEATGTALGHLAKIERLQSQRDALVRKLGLDWGPDEFGDLDSVPTPINTDRGGIVVNMEPPHGSSSTDNYAIGYSAGLRNGRRGR